MCSPTMRSAKNSWDGRKDVDEQGRLEAEHRLLHPIQREVQGRRAPLEDLHDGFPDEQAQEERRRGPAELRHRMDVGCLRGQSGWGAENQEQHRPLRPRCHGKDTQNGRANGG